MRGAVDFLPVRRVRELQYTREITLIEPKAQVGQLPNRLQPN